MGIDKETIRFGALAWLDTAEKTKIRKGDAAKQQAFRLAAINLMIADGSTREVIQYVNFIMGQPLQREWGEGGDAQRARARMAAAKFEAEHYARAYREENLDPSETQHIKPADVTAVAQVYAAEMKKAVGACRSQIRVLRRMDDYQMQVGSFVLEMVQPRSGM